MAIPICHTRYIVKVRSTENRPRLEIFDLLRGFFIFGIIVNHLALFPNIFTLITGGTKLWVSFAEGFFMISGFFVGYLYRDKIMSEFRTVFLKLTKRAFRLYLWSIYLTILFTYWGNYMPVGLVKESLWILHPENLKEFIQKVVLLQYNYGWADILPFYAVFLVISPLYLWLLTRGLAPVLLSLNIMLWFLRGSNSYLAIQILFFFGVVVGFYGERIQQYWQKKPREWRFKFRTIIYGTFLITLVLSYISVFWFRNLVSGLPMADYLILKNRVLNWYFDKQTVGAGRLLLSPIWVMAFYFLFVRYLGVIKKYFGWLLYVFGVNSLRSYIVHAFVIYPVPYFVFLIDHPTMTANSLITFIAVIVIYLITRLMVIYGRMRIA